MTNIGKKQAAHGAAVNVGRKMAVIAAESREALQRVSEYAQLSGVTLLNASIQLIEPPVKASKLTQENQEYVELSDYVKGAPKFEVLCDLENRGSLQGSGGEEAEAYRIRALYKLTYALAKRKEIEPKDLKRFAAINAPHNVWSFWREFVHSMTMRMGLPPVTIPLRPPLIIEQD